MVQRYADKKTATRHRAKYNARTRSPISSNLHIGIIMALTRKAGFLMHDCGPHHGRCDILFHEFARR